MWFLAIVVSIVLVTLLYFCYAYYFIEERSPSSPPLLPSTIIRHLRRERLRQSIVMNLARPRENGKFYLDGFDVGLTPKSVIKLKRLMNNEYFLLMQWNETEDIAYIMYKAGTKYCPQLIIAYFESIFVWKDD
ncbi:chromobox protein homolog 5-like [Melanaphis sacchari]|uniref:chromobox protein homolog 5-like n=1 Tax=Melanaphis sacchari TaxID=742174 RepID=UPI000DC15132|nr:chromobox protein homolog 5-like [Melanaphis sacchari]